MLLVKPATTRAEMRDFHGVPFRVFADDPNWVPPLHLERVLHFSKSHNPYLQHATASYWVAYEDGAPVGRISAQIDDLHLERFRDATGHFGFLDAVDDPAVFRALLEAAEAWLVGRRMRRAVGPLSFSMWDQAGLLVEGFDSPPRFMMGHARPYYGTHIEAAGYAKAEDLLAFGYDRNMALPPLASRIVRRALDRGEMTIRTIRKDRKHLPAEINLLMDIVNDGWADNWGFVPITAAEMKDIGLLIRTLLREGDVAIAEHKGEAAAFTLVMPDINEAIRDLGGKLGPFNWAKLLWRLKVARPKGTRMPFMGIRKKYQTTPLGAAMALGVIEAARGFNIAYGAEVGELSWVLDRNERVKHIIDLVGARVTKRYRVYEKPLV